MMNSYRSRIYEEYASHFKGSGQIFDEAKAKKFAQAYQWYLRNWLPREKNIKILDAACGEGNLLYFFKQRGFQSVGGVDISPEQVALARQVVPEVAETNILDFLTEQEDEFDLIIGLDIIEHFYKEEVLIFLDRCFRALKPGGRLILQTPNADSFWSNSYRYNDFTHEVCFGPKVLRQLMEFSRFSELEAREAGPPLKGFYSTLRLFLWQIIRVGLKCWNLVETGDCGSRIYTRVFFISGRKSS